MSRLWAPVLVSLIAVCGFAQDKSPATQPAAESRPAEVKPDHPRLGVRCDTITLEKSGIARVESVQAGSPADKAGMKVGDVIVSIGPDKITDDMSYRKAMARKKTGDTFTVSIKRGDASQELSVALFAFKRPEPDEVTVQHCLIGCSDGKPSRNPAEKKRTAEEAKKLAEEILQKVKDGADFGALVKQYTEDPGSKNADPPGKYLLANDGHPKEGAIDRATFVAGFTAVAFALEVGDAAITPYDKDLSPFGFHIIKRAP